MATVAVTNKTDAKRVRRALRRVVYVLMALGVIITVSFFLLPVWLSNEQGRQYVLGRLNKRLTSMGLPAEGSGAGLQAAHWQLSWFGGIQIDDLSFTAADGTTLLRVPRLETEWGLWSWLWGSRDVGTTRIVSPQVVVVKRADGTTHVDAWVTKLLDEGELLKHLRGAIQITGADVELRSEGTASSIRLTNVTADVPIASPTSPVLVVLQGTSNTRTEAKPVRFEGTLPAPASWRERPWGTLQTVDLKAGAVPTAAVCDFLKMDTTWALSVGPVLDEIVLSNRTTGGSSRPQFLVKGGTGRIQGQLTAQWPAMGGRPVLSLTAGQDALDAAMGVSPALNRWLGRVNPVFMDVVNADGPVAVAVQELYWPTGDVSKAQGVLRLTPPRTMRFSDHGVLGKLVGIADRPAGGATKPAGDMMALVQPMRVRVGEGQSSVGEMLMTVEGGPSGQRRRFRFAGAVGFDGQVELVATIPLTTQGGMSSGTAELPIRGTIDKPVVVVPR